MFNACNFDDLRALSEQANGLQMEEVSEDHHQNSEYYSNPRLINTFCHKWEWRMDGLNDFKRQKCAKLP
jgi:hypothetical protein